MATTASKRKKIPEIDNPAFIEAKGYFQGKDYLLTPPLLRAAYSDRMAWICASMSHLAYDQFELGNEEIDRQFEAKLESGGFKLIDTFNSDKTGTQAFLAANDNFAVLAFRGTEKNWLDVQTDILARRVRTSSGRIHAGFRQAYDSVAPKIEVSLKKIGKRPLYITGHSLGGALATVATESLESNPKFEFQVAACYSFGSPRVGNAEYDPNIKSSFFRIVNTADIVTVIPLLAMGFVHVGDIRFLERRNELFRRGIPFFRRLFAFIFAFSNLVADHGIAEYRRKLELIAKRRSRSLFGDSRSPGR
jgi:triacylglycerol lipase